MLSTPSITFSQNKPTTAARTSPLHSKIYLIRTFDSARTYSNPGTIQGLETKRQNQSILKSKDLSELSISHEFQSPSRVKIPVLHPNSTALKVPFGPHTFDSPVSISNIVQRKESDITITRIDSNMSPEMPNSEASLTALKKMYGKTEQPQSSSRLILRDENSISRINNTSVEKQLKKAMNSTDRMCKLAKNLLDTRIELYKRIPVMYPSTPSQSDTVPTRMSSSQIKVRENVLRKSLTPKSKLNLEESANSVFERSVLNLTNSTELDQLDQLLHNYENKEEDCDERHDHLRHAPPSEIRQTHTKSPRGKLKLLKFIGQQPNITPVNNKNINGGTSKQLYLPMLSESTLRKRPLIVPIPLIQLDNKQVCEGDDSPICDSTTTTVSYGDFASSPKETQKKRRPILKIKSPKGDGVEYRKYNTLSLRRVTFILKAKHTLKSLLWTMTLGPVLMRSINKFVLQKRIIRTENFPSIFQRDKEIFMKFASEHLKKPLLELAQEKKFLYIVNPKIPMKEVKNRCVRIHEHLISILEATTLAINNGGLESSFFKSLVKLIGTNAVIPENYLTQFELQRLEFTHSGTLKNMTEPRSKMLLGGYVLLRIMLYEVIMRPWEVLSQVAKESVNLRNLLNIGSVFYHALRDIFMIYLSPLKDNQILMQLDARVKCCTQLPSPLYINIDDGVSDDVRRAKADLKDQIAKGFYSRSLLASFIQENSELYQDIRGCLEDLLECFYKKTYTLYMENRLEFDQPYLPK